MKIILKTVSAITLAATAVLAGLPLICERLEIGNSKSLPWKNVNAWNGADPAYSLASLTTDTLAILTPAAPLPLRMETLRRAAIYAATDAAVIESLTARLLARVADTSLTANPKPTQWFDAGYFVEALRQLGSVFRFYMLSPNEKSQWQIRGDAFALNGKPWIEQAIRLGGKGMEVALSKIEEYRNADLNRNRRLLSQR